MSAWAGLTDGEPPPVQHFTYLDDCAGFLREGAARVLGFFPKVDAPEHTVFLTVAQQLGAANDTADGEPGVPKARFGRATVGKNNVFSRNKVQGATVYVSPRSTARAPNGSVVPALLMHTYRVPPSPKSDSLLERWRELPRELSAGPVPGAPPPPPGQMWQDILESEALVLHRWVQAASLPDVSHLTDPMMMDALSHRAYNLGILIFPSGFGAALRGYHTRRLANVASRFTPLRCHADGQGQGMGWLEERYLCGFVKREDSARFAYVDAGKEFAAMLFTRLRIPFSALPKETREVSFAMIQRSKLAGDEQEWQWKVHALPEKPTAAAMDKFVRNRLEAAKQKDEL
jgi:hypothetical protein